jgi:hypothetical protein
MAPLPLAAPAGGNHHPWRAGMWLALAVPCLASCFLMVPIFSSLRGPPPALGAVVGCATVGCILAQGNLLAAWLVWSAQPFARRFVVHWVIAAALFCCWLIGLMVGENTRDFAQIATAVGMLVPVISLAAQLPLWFMRHTFGWRLVALTRPALRADDVPLSIRDLFIATLVVAITFGVVRLLPLLQIDNGNVWNPIAVAMVATGVISTLAMLPAGILLFHLENFRRGLIFSVLYAASLVALLWLIVGILWWYVPAALAPYGLYVGLSSLMLSFAATLLLAANVARAQGYRLVWGRRSRNS